MVLETEAGDAVDRRGARGQRLGHDVLVVVGEPDMTAERERRVPLGQKALRRRQVDDRGDRGPGGGVGLDLGADDYLVKPATPEQLAAAIFGEERAAGKSTAAA